jgi:hypothetical protein
MPSRSRKTRNSFLVLGALLTIACVDVFTQSRQCVGVKTGLAIRSQSVSTKTGTSGHSRYVDVVEYSVGGRTFQLDGGSRSPRAAEDGRIFWEPSGEEVVVWYYGRLPGFAWLGERAVGSLLVAFVVAIYWAVLLAVLSGRFRRKSGRWLRQ